MDGEGLEPVPVCLTSSYTSQLTGKTSGGNVFQGEILFKEDVVPTRHFKKGILQGKGAIRWRLAYLVRKPDFKVSHEGTKGSGRARVELYEGPPVANYNFFLSFFETPEIAGKEGYVHVNTELFPIEYIPDIRTHDTPFEFYEDFKKTQAFRIIRDIARDCGEDFIPELLGGGSAVVPREVVDSLLRELSDAIFFHAMLVRLL